MVRRTVAVWRQVVPRRKARCKRTRSYRWPGNSRWFGKIDPDQDRAGNSAPAIVQAIQLRFPPKKEEGAHITDTENWRVKKCTLAGVCEIFAADVEQATDVAVDSTGNVFVSSNYNSFRVLKYTSLGVYLEDFAGVYTVPYLTDTTRLHAPSGVAVDSSGNVYVVEDRGHRLIKMNAEGDQLWTIGQVGVTYRNNETFNHLRGNPAVDAAG